MWRAIIVLAALLLPCFAMAQSGSETLFDPVTGYRIVHYRGVVAKAPEGVERIDTTRARALWRIGAIFIDVNPAAGAVRDDATGHWKLAEPHPSVPGVYWFPETGRGTLEPAIEHYFLEGVSKLSRARPAKAIVIFCQADCWMSWNAALRLHRAGFTKIVWFADGLDGWKEASLPVALATPF